MSVRPSHSCARAPTIYAAAIILLCIGFLSPKASAAPVKIRFATDWKAQAEQGGFYQAKALGLYTKAGLDVEIVPGGPGTNIPQLLGAGAIDFAMGSNSFIPLNMVRAGVPARAVMAAFQKDPQVLISHPRPDITSLADMRGKPIMISDASINSFWVWLRAEYGFSDRQIRKYTFNPAPFIVNQKAIQQGYVSSEPFTIKQKAGITPQVFLLSDYGYPSYASMIMAHNDWIETRPSAVQAFVDASRAGWLSYVYGDPAPGNALILEQNPDMTAANIAHAISELRARNIVKSEGMRDAEIGRMTEARWQRFFEIMARNDVYAADLDWRAAFTTQFLTPEKGIGQ